MFSEKLQLSLVNNTPIRNLIDDFDYTQGQAGFVKNGLYAWIIHDSNLEILSSETGVKVAHYNFGKNHGPHGCIINCVEEIDYLPGVCLLAVATEFTASGASAGMISIFCIHGSKILGSMDFCERITCCRYIETSACQRSVLRQFKGTLAIGTDKGKLFFIDLMIPSNPHEIVSSPSYESELFPCINIPPSVEQAQIALSHQRVSAADHQVPEKTFFSIQLEVLDDSGAVLSILCMPNLYTMAVGLNDGRLVLYDLARMEPFHLAYPPKNRAPLTHMSFLEPTDDPRCAVYIWTLHSSSDGVIAVMHSLMFENKINRIYEVFKSCSVRLTMPIYVRETFPICCRAITRNLTQDDEDVLTLNVLAWASPEKKLTNILIFDLNQWYKEEMPSVGDWRLKLKYVAVFELQGTSSLDVIVNENSVFPFNSIMRPEEHFYPNSLSFDACLLESNKFSHYRWFGLQNIVLQQFNVIGPQIILEPSYYFNELLQVAITPQFSDATYNVATPIEQKREFLLSVALEYNFNGFLKKCAEAWADGSFLGRDESSGIGLSTLTDWIWRRVREIKDVCNELCRPLFDFSEQRIDYGTQKQLSQCCKQLKVLSDLLTIIVRDYRRFIPDHVLVQLGTQSETIKMASDYQEVLQWLLNVGLLPEGHYGPDDQHHDVSDEFLIVPYPYQTISAYYDAQRMKLNEDWSDDDNDDRRQVESSKFLFIDKFIEQECNSKALREIWNGVYPPRSIQALLRTLLVPDISIHNKHVIFVYLFMDITNVLSEGVYSSIVRNLIKFPAVFKMNPAIIKRTQAFWNLDNGHLGTAVEELISPLSHDKHLPLWQRELLIGALLKQNANSLALRALRCPGNQISPDLEMLTLLSNNLMSEALKVQRSSGDRKLLEKLFEKILQSPSYEQLLDLSLTEEEGNVLRDCLKNLDTNHMKIHFVFLLQRSKFLDAAQLVESMDNDSSINMEPPKQVLNAYYATMESTTRRLTSMVHTEDVQAKESPLPLSVNLIQARCNAKNDIYQKCVQSITEAAYDTSQTNAAPNRLPFIGSPKLGIFEYKQTNHTNIHDLSYNLEVNEHGKRRQIQKSDETIRIEDFDAPKQKKRRLEDSVVAKRKSYMDIQINNLTVFKEMKPNFNFTKRTPNSSIRTTPERVQMFGNFLNTPIVQKKTPPKKFTDKGPGTPHSILKTRSHRGSVSPAPSRISEFGDDNKSVKSITFALPDSRDTSMNDSFNDEPMESSAEAFYSPGKSPEGRAKTSLDGPKPRKPIKSRSTTPLDSINPPIEEASPPLLEEVIAESDRVVNNDHVEEESKLDETMSSEGSQDYGRPFREEVVAKETSSDEDSEASDSSTPDKSIFNYVRRSVLPGNYGEVSDSSSNDEAEKQPAAKDSETEDSEMVADEHFEEEELPEHSDYDDSSDNEENGDEYEYGNLDLDDSDESDSHDSHPPPQQRPPPPPSRPAPVNEIICLDSSSDDEEDIREIPPALPSFGDLGNVQRSNPPATDVFDDLVNVQPSDDVQIVQSQEEMFEVLYGNIQEPESEKMETGDDENVEIESPVYEEIAPVAQTSSDESLIPTVEAELEDYSFASLEPAPLNDTVIMSQESVPDSQSEILESAQEACEIASTVEIEDFVKMPVAEEAEVELELAENIVENVNEEEMVSSSQADDETIRDVPKFQQTEEVQQSEIIYESHNQLDEAETVPTYICPLDELMAASRKRAEEESLRNKEQTETANSSDVRSAECSFVSASGGELNEAVIFSNLTTEQSGLLVNTRGPSDVFNNAAMISVDVTNDLPSQIEDDEAMESARQSLADSEIEAAFSGQESSNTLNNAQFEEEMHEEAEITSTFDNQAMDLSMHKSPGDRVERAKSVPSSSASSSPRSRSRSSRAATEDRENPKNLLKGKMLERIEENVTPVPSPGRLTRSKSQLLEAGEHLELLHTPTKLTRRRSHLSEEGSDSPKLSASRRTSTGTPSTPRRLTRAASKDNLGPSESDLTPEEPAALSRQGSQRSLRKRATSATSGDESDVPKKGKLTRQTSKLNVVTRKMSGSLASLASASADEDSKSTRSMRSSTKKSTPSSSSKVTPEKTSPVADVPSTSNRRLTRKQLQVIEKSRLIAEKISSAGTLRATKSDNITSSTSRDDSDDESIKSESGSNASSRPRRKRQIPQRNVKEDDSSSVASKSSRKSMTPTKLPKLSVIPEESTIEEAVEDEPTTSSQRSRKTKK